MLNEQKLARALLALDNLNFMPGDWTPDAKIRHLTEQMQQAKTYLMQCMQSEDGVTPGTTQVYATIHPASKYASQCNGEAFPVKFTPDTDGFHWKGGIGGQYRLSDLSLHIKKNNKAVAIPIFNAHEDLQLLDRILAPYEREATKGYQDPDWITQWTTKLIHRLDKLEKTTRANYVEEED